MELQNIQEIKSVIAQELPAIMRYDDDLRQYFVDIAKKQFDKQQKESDRRFDNMINELATQRQQNYESWKEQHKLLEHEIELNQKRWEEQKRRDAEQIKKSDERWEEQKLKDAEQKIKRDERWEKQKQKDKDWWEEVNRKYAEQIKKSDERWEEQKLKDAEQRQKEDERWEDHMRKEHDKLMARLDTITQRTDSVLGALGARWGLNSEQSFRNGLKGILEDNFDVKVVTINDFDDDGDVFGRPDQVELDIIIKNGVLIICELKSSMSKSDMYIFERKVRWYEKRHNREASKMIVISPMVDDRAKKVADDLWIEIYTHASDVATL